jgi:hypothetical protein
MNSINCVFRHDGHCDHSGSVCGKPCRLQMQSIVGLSYRDHFDIYENRRIFRYDMGIKWFTLVISLIALWISVANLVWKLIKP